MYTLYSIAFGHTKHPKAKDPIQGQKIVLLKHHRKDVISLVIPRLAKAGRIQKLPVFPETLPLHPRVSLDS